MARTPQEELRHFVSDLYSVELQALAQLASAPDLAGSPELAEDYRLHLTETEGQAERMRQRLEALGGSPSTIKDTIMRLGGKGFLLFARFMPETPGRLLVHSYSYEAMEWAGYEVLIHLAQRAGDPVTMETARGIQEQERTMLQRLEGRFQTAESLSHHDVPVENLPKHVRTHLTEVHAIETQSQELLKKGAGIAGSHELARLYGEHLEETQDQIRALERRLDAMDSSPSAIKDAALKLGALNWGMFFQSQSDTPCKLLAFSYAMEHLEIGAYELLRCTARRAGDRETEQLCDQILAQERAMADRLAQNVDLSVRVTLEEVWDRAA